MNELYQVIILIFLVCSSLVTNSCGQHVCVESGIACDSCTTLALCQGTEKTPNPCPSGKLCGEISETMAGCFDSSKTEAKACKCTKWPSLKADPYDGQKYIACITPTFQLYEECGDDKIFIESEQECLESTTSPPTTPTTPLPPPECDEEGFSTNDPTCKTWYYCFMNNGSWQATTIYPCEPPEYFFDDRVKVCVPEADLKPKEFVCPSDVDGGVMDTEKCDVFHICFAGKEVGDPIPCKEVICLIKIT
ncbi:hypothetical protein SK128_003677 [Halocaridina rubra]|uniref:Chitin-binding type-2 domain-containing protein n=1 Tax=Halocaridina rubra TaxID=373956 RepID=A0AAN8XKJ1_HALRR